MPDPGRQRPPDPRLGRAEGQQAVLEQYLGAVGPIAQVGREIQVSAFLADDAALDLPQCDNRQEQAVLGLGGQKGHDAGLRSGQRRPRSRSCPGTSFRNRHRAAVPRAAIGGPDHPPALENPAGAAGSCRAGLGQPAASGRNQRPTAPPRLARHGRVDHGGKTVLCILKRPHGRDLSSYLAR